MTAGEQSIHFQVHACPHCGFSYEEMEEGELRDDVRRFVQKVITPQLPEGAIPSWKKYEYLALIDESLGAGFYSLGMLYLHSAWCCYDLKEIELEKHYRKLAIEYFIMETGSRSRDQDLIYLVPYLLGEQYRRIGEMKEAARWYDMVMEMDQEHPDSGFFMTLAAQQKFSPKEFMGEIIHEEQ
jgi:tetratricopeptide (TPR) repeat protein